MPATSVPSPAFPWYDSIWLQQFEWARLQLRAHNPGALARLEAHVAPLRTRTDFQALHLPGWLSAAELEGVRRRIATLGPSALDAGEAQSFRRFVARDDPHFLALQAEQTPRIAALAGEAIEPTYNFLSLYGAQGTCPLHLDSPESKWTLDICVSQTRPWPIHFSRTVEWPTLDTADVARGWEERLLSDPALGFRSIAMEPGDAILFSGSAQWHYREPLSRLGPRGSCDLLFFHFMPTGALASLQPRLWARDLAIAELTPAEAFPEAPWLGRRRARQKSAFA